MIDTDIKVAYNCNNNCYFCVQGLPKRFQYDPKPLKQVKQILDEEHARGIRGVVFTGGEPTMYKDLKKCVAHAHKLGYQRIVIQSNGQNFSDYDLVKEYIELGVTRFNPSLHGAKPETHDYLTKTKGAWKKVVKGIQNIHKLGGGTCINHVITKQNYKEAPQFAMLLAKLGVTIYQYAFPHILGNAHHYRNKIIPRKTDIMPYIHKGLLIARKKGIITGTEAIPYCFMQGFEWAIGERDRNDLSIHDVGHTESYKEFIQTIGKIKHTKCKRCIKNNVCEGPWVEYPELYGWEEFIPITNN